MFLADVSVRRPVAMSCLIIGLALLGMYAFFTMGVELMPKVDMPIITITTVYPGAGPEEMESDVAKPIEDQVLAIDGIKHVTSSCMENVVLTFLEFDLGTNVDIAATDVREKLDLILGDFPSDVENPRILKYDVNAKPVVQLALTGDVPLMELYDYADNTLRNKMSVIEGVADVQLIGGARQQVHVLLERNKLGARGITSLEAAMAIQGGLRIIPSGRIKEKGTEYAVKFDADVIHHNDIQDLEISSDDGKRCYVKDIGAVMMATEELRQKATIDGKPCVAVKILKKSDGNAVSVVNRINDAVMAIEPHLPGGMELVWITDDGEFIKANMYSALINVAQGVFLTALILFFFLYHIRALFVVALTMPLTIIISLFFIQFLGFSINTLTLLAMGMSVGILVTNSIVVLEAIIKRLDETGDPKTASRIGAKEAAIAVIASAGTNMVVLFPLSMMHSMVGLFMRSFALTMLVLTLVSLFISFTLTPLLCSILLKPEKKTSFITDIEQKWNEWFADFTDRYRLTILAIREKKWISATLITGFVIVFIHSLYLATTIGASMVTDPDQALLFAKLEFPSDYTLNKTENRVKDAEAALKDMPHLKHLLTTVGKVEGRMGQISEGIYLAQILLKFSSKTSRDLSIEELIESARSRLASFTDCIVSVTQPIVIGGQSSDIEMEIGGENLQTLDDLALKVQALSTKIDGILEQDTTVRAGKPELRIIPNRPVLSDLKVNAAQMGMVIRTNLEGITVGTYKQSGRSYDVVVKLKEEKGKNQVRDFLFPGAPGRPLLLSTLASIEETTAPVQITRKNKIRISKLFANLGVGKPLTTAVTEIAGAMDERANLPPGYHYSFSGLFEYLRESQVEMLRAGLIAIVLVYLTLSAIMESFKQPAVILLAVPPALTGMFWALFATGRDMDIFVMMSIILLLGIVVNNAILVMDRFNENIKQAVAPENAMIQAACDRFRPIVMITLASVAGMLPLAFGNGLGSELRNACGIASIGGILISGIVATFAIPVAYHLFSRKYRPTSKTACGPLNDAKSNSSCQKKPIMQQ